MDKIVSLKKNLVLRSLKIPYTHQIKQYGEKTWRRKFRTAKTPYGKNSYCKSYYDEKSYGKNSGHDFTYTTGAYRNLWQSVIRKQTTTRYVMYFNQYCSFNNIKTRDSISILCRLIFSSMKNQNHFTICTIPKIYL